MKIKLLLLTLTFVLSNSALAINKCDELAAHPNNKDNPQGVKGVASDDIDRVPAIIACFEALVDEPNNQRFQYQVGRALDQNGNYTHAIKWYKKAAEQGYAYAQNDLGYLYVMARGVERDYQTAVSWYRKAAEQGNASAQRHLGIMYYEGHGVEQDDKTAVTWFRKAAEQGDVDAQVDLADMYKHGTGVKQDYKTAIVWYRKAAEQGDYTAQGQLGFLYYKGYGVEQDYKTAISWWRKAAKKGNPLALYNLGFMYANGYGVEEDSSKAMEFLKKAARFGSPDAKDWLIIGGGPGGYVAAIRAAQLGKKVACVEMYRHNGYGVENRPSLGGTCLNVGCIPSKVLLESSEHLDKLRHLGEHGISINSATMDIKKMIERKENISAQLTVGIEQLFKANKIDWIQGRGKLIAKDKVSVIDFDGNVTEYAASNVILASGSVPIDIPVAKMDGKYIVDSTGALNFTSVPKRLGVIGAGVIGLELGSVWHRLTSQVTILEASDKLLPMFDQEVAKDAGRQFKQQGLDIKLGSAVKKAEVIDNEVVVTYEDKKGEHTQIFDKLLVCVGRRPNTADLIGESVGVKLDERGFIIVDEHCQTGVAGVYAIGDSVRGPMLAHKASEEGVMVAEIIDGQAGHCNLDLIPSIIYTHPEIAAIGKTEEQLKAEGVNYKKGDFPFAANGRAKAMDADKGRVKILADADTDEILGGHIVGPMASELIQELVVAMEYKAASEDIARICHGHPGLGEAIHEAALAVDGRALHKVNK